MNPPGGKPETRSPERLRQRIAEKIQPFGDCWQWTGTISHLGYGQMSIGKGKQPAHRVAYEVHVGPVPEGLELDHLCRNRACVNPEHLEPVTHAENMRRSEHPNFVTHLTGVCQRGHDMANDWCWTNRARGLRACRQCRNQMSNERRARQRARDRERRAQGERTSTPAA